MKRTMTVKAKLTLLVPLTVVLGISFMLMENVLVGRVIVAAVWVAHLAYFGFVVRTEPSGAVRTPAPSEQGEG